MFIQEEQLRQLVRQLNAEEGDELRLRALETLLHTQLSELVGGDEWAALKAGLAACLTDTVGGDRVADLGLKVFSRLLASSSHFAVKEAVVSLVETVLNWYKDRRPVSVLPAASVEERSPIMHRRLMGVLQLLAAQCRELPKLWVRQVEPLDKYLDSFPHLATQFFTGG